MACLKISTKPLKLECHNDIVKMADRINKILFEKHGRRHSVLNVSSFPLLLEKEVDNFMMDHSLQASAHDDSEINSHDDSMYSPKRCFSVKEVNSDIEDEASEEEEKVLDLSHDRLKNVDDEVFNPK